MKNIRAKLLLLGTIVVALLVIFGDRKEASRGLKEVKSVPRGEVVPVVKPGAKVKLGGGGLYRAQVGVGVWEDEVAKLGNGWKLDFIVYEDRDWF